MAINSITGNTMLTSGSFPPVRAASTGAPLNPATGGLLVVDGVRLVAGDRVLCKDETSAVNNGIYAANKGPWVRTGDATGNTQFFSGMAVTVALGAVNAGQTFICTCPDDPVVVGTSLITFASQQAVATATQQATSPTSLTIGTGSQTLIIQAGKAFKVGQWVLIQESSNGANQMLGTITSYSGNTLAVSVVATGGSGTRSDWTIVLTNSAGAAGFQPPLGTGNVTGPGSSTAGHVATFADATGKVLADGGTIVGGPNTILPSMLATSAVAFGVGMLNGKLVASVGANALTIAVKTLAGNDPSSSDPVFFLFRDATAGYAVIEQTTALSITVPAGATLGTFNGQANRIWVGVFNNSGTAVLGVYNSLNSSAPSIVPWDETSPANGAGITAASTSPQIWYTASTLPSVVFRILGYVESTQATAGQWATSPSKVQLFGPGVKKPGEILQTLQMTTASNTSTSSTTFVSTVVTLAFTPTSAANPVMITSVGTLDSSRSLTNTTNADLGLFRGVTQIGATLGTAINENGAASTVQIRAPVTRRYLDMPATASSVTYTENVRSTQAGAVNYPTQSGSMILEEIQG